MRLQSLFHTYLSRIIVLLVVVILTEQCARTPPVTYYRLSPVDAGQEILAGSAFDNPLIGIGPLRLPEFLDRPQMIIRKDPNRLQLADSHRWIEPLAENIAQVLRENLAVLLNTERFLFYPWSRSTDVSYQLVVDIIRFEGEGFEEAHLEAVWSVQNGTGKSILPQQRNNYRVKNGTADHEGMVRALSETLFLFSRDIARQLTLTAMNLPE